MGYLPLIAKSLLPFLSSLLPPSTSSLWGQLLIIYTSLAFLYVLNFWPAFRRRSVGLQRCLWVGMHICKSRLVVSDSFRPHGLYGPWNSLSRILEWVAFPFFRGFSHSRDRTQVSHIAGRFFTSWATREALWVGRQN